MLCGKPNESHPPKRPKPALFFLFLLPLPGDDLNSCMLLNTKTQK